MLPARARGVPRAVHSPTRTGDLARRLPRRARCCHHGAVDLADDLAHDVGLLRQAVVLPPRELVVDGVPRRRNRRVDPAEAHRLLARGARGFLLTFGACGELPPERFGELLRAREADFLDQSSAGVEADLAVYGRRVDHRRDERILVACLPHAG